MKINHKDIKGLLRSYLEDRFPVSRAKCPLPDDITAFLRGKISKKRRNQIIDHIFHCAYCHEEFEFALKIIREEEKFINDLRTIVKEKEISKEKKHLQFFPFRPSWLHSLILITVVAMLTLLVKNITEERKYRGADTLSIALVTPNQKVTLRNQLKFEWVDIQNSDYYILEVFDESLYPIWKSNKITVNSTQLSKEITNRFLKHKTYYWMITAILRDGKIIESRLQDFRISD